MKGDDCGDRLPLSIPQYSLVPGSDPGLRMWLERGDAETQRSFKRLRRWSSLPIYVQPELHDARRIELRAQHPERLRRLQAHTRVRKLHHVEHIEELTAERGAPALRERELARERQIHIPPPQTAQLAAS